MFETSSLLFFKTLVVNILLPLIPGILFLRIFFGKKFQGLLLYLLGWFIGVGVVAFSLFNLQFFHFGVGIGEYFFVLLLLVIIFLLQMFYTQISFKTYLLTLKIPNLLSQIKLSFFHLSQTKKLFTLVSGIFGLCFLALSFVHTTNFPSYADDNFYNWNNTSYIIYQDGGVKLFGETSEILGKGRLGYPIYIAVYKATISHFVGGFNDVYIDMRQWLVFLGLLLFIFTITFTSTKNIFYSLLPIGLIVSLPLIFFHASDGYMDLPCAVYSVLMIWSLWKFLEEKDYAYIPLALLLGSILSHLKNDGLLMYFLGILIAFSLFLLFSQQLSVFLSGLFRNKKAHRFSLFILVFFFLPFLFVKLYYHLGFSPTESTVGLALSGHWEVLSAFKTAFFAMDTYNVVLIPIILLLLFGFSFKKQNKNILFLLFSPSIIFLLFLFVFLFTENYIFALNQTTCNRVFTMVFVILLSFIGLFLYKKGNDIL